MRTAHVWRQGRYAAGTLPAVVVMPMIVDMEIGKAIDHFCKLQGLNQSQLAARLGADQGNLSRMLNGKQGIPVSKLQQIAEALGVRGSDILAFAEDQDDTAARWRKLYQALPEDEREAALKILEPRGQYAPKTRLT